MYQIDEGQGPPPARCCVLIIDDEPHSLRVMVEALRGLGLELATAVSAAAGEKNALVLRPDLILLDVTLPDGDGYAVCRALTVDPLTAEIPIIFLTARVEPEALAKGFAAGGVDYITKPFRLEEVVLRVQCHLKLAARRRSLEELPGGGESPGATVGGPRPPSLGVDTPRPAQRVLLRALERLLGDLGNAPDLDTLAAYAGSNRTTLGQMFKRHLGMSVFDFLREQRLQEGRRLLDYTDLAVKAIAEAVGYCHGRDFSTAFKGRFGLTPAGYRESHPRGEPFDTALTVLSAGHLWPAC